MGEASFEFHPEDTHACPLLSLLHSGRRPGNTATHSGQDFPPQLM